MNTTSPASFDLSAYGLTVAEVHRNLPPSALYEHAIRYEKDASIADNGALVAYSGTKTGRSPKDKRVVENDASKKDIWWGPVNIPFDSKTFQINRQRAIDYLNTRERLYCFDGFAGWDPKYRIKVPTLSRVVHAHDAHPSDEGRSRELRGSRLCNYQWRRIPREQTYDRHGFDHEHRSQPRRQGISYPRY
jgi:phosphoenolpyruvate carboxykinase (ATP)